MTDIAAARPPMPTISRLTALFQQGEVVEVGEDENGPVLVWVNALTSIEREECILDGAVAQAAERELNGPGSAAYEATRSELDEAERDKIIEALLNSRASEAWILGQDDLHADEDWRGDKLLLIERMDASVQSGMELSDEERERFLALNQEYRDAWLERSQSRIEAMRSEYRAQETRELVAAFLKAWTDHRALKAQADEYRISQLFYSTRVCHARKMDDSFDHADCLDHPEMVFPNRATVRRAADELVNLLVPVADRIDKLGADALGKR